jgi:hypothetical protein
MFRESVISQRELSKVNAKNAAAAVFQEDSIEDVLYHMMIFCNVKELTILARVSTFFKKLTEDKNIWIRQINIDFPSHNYRALRNNKKLYRELLEQKSLCIFAGDGKGLALDRTFSNLRRPIEMNEAKISESTLIAVAKKAKAEKRLFKLHPDISPASALAIVATGCQVFLPANIQVTVLLEIAKRVGDENRVTLDASIPVQLKNRFHQTISQRNTAAILGPRI